MSTEELLTPRGTLPRQRSPLRRVLPRKSGEGHSRRFVAPGLDAAIWVILIDVVALTLAILLVSGGRIALTLLVTIVILLNASGGLYRSRVSPSLLDELPELVGRGLVAGAIATAVAIFVDVPVQQGPVHAAVIYLLIACTGRVIGYPILRRTRTVHGAGRPTIIVGEGLVGEQIATTLLSHREYGLLPVGFVDDNPLLSENDSHIPFLGTIRSLSGLLDKYQVRNIIVAFTSTRESRMVEILRRCDRARCEIYVVPRFYELDAGGRNTELIWGLPLTRLRRSAYRSPSWRVKRIFDIVAAGLGLIVLSPLLALCALAVRLEGGPGVIFRQERVGVDGRRFMILKFRSLKPSSDAESAALWSIAGDPRLGPVGKRLRQLSLDELPQLWNILLGDMSLVGPRPERPVFVDEFCRKFPQYVSRHRVPVGLTGWAQINGLRGDTDISDRADFDNFYIENWSIWTDVKIMLRTVGQVVGGRGL